MDFKYPPQSLLVNVNSIDDSSRTRTDYGDLSELAESIATNGLIHPPVIDNHNRLIAGGRRLRAMRDILKVDQIPVLVLETLDDTHLAILEAEENIRRKQMSWQERVLGVAKVHETAKRGAILNAKKWTIVETGDMLGVSFSNVNNALTLARYIRAGDKKVLAAATITDALKVLLDYKLQAAQKVQAEFLLTKGAEVKLPSNKALAKELNNSDDDFFSPTPAPIGGFSAGIVAPVIDLDEVPGAPAPEAPKGPVPEVALSKFLHKGRMEDVCFNLLGPETVDHIVCDPPYGIDMLNLDQDGSGINNIESVAAEHDVEANLVLFPKMFKAAFHVLKPNGFFILWYDLDHHEKLQVWACEAGFRVQRWPLIWHKTHQCINQYSSKNFTKNFEVAMVCRKGNASLLSAQNTSVWAGTNDDLKIQLGHPFVKPLRLWQWLFNAVAMRGQTVLDPFAGVGSSTIAAIDFGLVPVAIECNDQHFDRLVINVANQYKKLNPNTKFF